MSSNLRKKTKSSSDGAAPVSTIRRKKRTARRAAAPLQVSCTADWLESGAVPGIALEINLEEQFAIADFERSRKS